ncbi:hypothetical protein ACTXT7_013034 [Hymenolepis weldensis]
MDFFASFNSWQAILILGEDGRATPILGFTVMEAMMRERSERIRKSEEEREMRRKRLESIMSRVNRSDRSLSRGIPNSGSSNSLTGSVTGVSSGNGIDEDSVKSGATVHFSLAPNSINQEIENRGTVVEEEAKSQGINRALLELNSDLTSALRQEIKKESNPCLSKYRPSGQRTAKVNDYLSNILMFSFMFQLGKFL